MSDSRNKVSAQTNGAAINGTLVDIGKIRVEMGQIELMPLKSNKRRVGSGDGSLMGQTLGQGRD